MLFLIDVNTVFRFQIQYIETSAKNPPVNVDLIFHDLIRIIR